MQLLLSHFHFELFVAYGNVIDPFVDRAFGHNYDAESQRDVERLESEVQRLDAERAGWGDEKSALLRDKSALQAAHADLRRELDLAREQMRMASDSRWLKLGHSVGLGPKFR